MGHEDSFPYEYGSDLHWLWGWGQRIELLICKDGHIPSSLDWMVFRPDSHAADAMMVFRDKHPGLIEELKEQLKETEDAYSQLLKDKSERNEFILADRMEVMSRKIRRAAELILGRSGKRTGSADEVLLPHKEKLRDRNAWLLKLRQEGATWEGMKEKLAENQHGWLKLGTPQGVKKATETEAERVGVTLPKGKGGAPSSKN